ncbi:MAG: carbon-nitrogen hydrolase family protein [Dehalococcoidia bacterium]|nr:carbon-nitrogen hydrolase family protein [Dehalococcoidia bacterium]
MTDFSKFTMAAVQASPAYFDKTASTEKACRLIAEAASQGATVAAFAETWLPGYPFFNRAEESQLKTRAHAEYIANGIVIPGPETERLCAAAKRGGVDVVIGVVELDANTRGSVYCTLLFISSEGEILGRHRKLKPTFGERTIWAEGDGQGLRVYQRPYARLSGLNCWEHMMMLPGYAIAAQGAQVHVAAWPSIVPGSKGLLLSRAFAAQAACYVIAVGGMRTPDDLPEHLRELAPDGLGTNGGSVIINPQGDVIAGPVDDEETILIAEGSLENVTVAKAICDIGGHYSRPDVLQLHVNNGKPARLVAGDDARGAAGASSDIGAGAPEHNGEPGR